MTITTDFNSRLVKVVPAEFQPGHELHVMTSDAFATRVLNLRLHRNIPSVRGYTGYTRHGFMLSRDEARILLESMIEAINDDDLWEEEIEAEVIPMTGDSDES